MEIFNHSYACGMVSIDLESNVVSNTAMITGLSIGMAIVVSLLVAVVVTIIICFVCRRHRRKRSKYCSQCYCFHVYDQEAVSMFWLWLSDIV